ncbi:unnamed protein product [Linum trigynum]|uniref:Uncharacterized protein n=1 Tax=Linum trigynum TaxID=586398 RepID=A0AAV2DVD3_9ROSI
MATDGAFQVAIIALTVAVFVAIQYLSKLFLSRQRANNRTALQSNRHFIQGSQFLARARSAAAKNSSQSQSLAKQALAEAESAAALSPKDPAPLVLKSVALDLLGHKAAALKAIDSALSPPRGKALQGKERGDALVKRAELKVAVNRRRRVDSAIEDLTVAVQLGASGEKGYCLLGQCYEWKGSKEDAKWAYSEALKFEPNSKLALDALGGLSS